MNANIALNNSACIQSQNNIGSTVYHNICNGSTHIVAWGTGDWTIAIFAAVFIGGLILTLVGLFLLTDY